MRKTKRIAIVTGGGDCPGINAVIRAVTKKAILEHGMEVIGIKDAYQGLVKNKHKKLTYSEVSGILTSGGTILGTSNKSDPYNYKVGDRYEDLSHVAIQNLKNLNIDCLVCVGGDGTLSIANKLYKDGVPIVGVPKTIDNDLRGTDVTFGFDSAVSIATEGIDRIHTTAESHHRIMIVEVMGRTAGWIALHAGIAGGGDIILIPEIPYDIDVIAKNIKERRKKGKNFSIVVIAEGAKPKGGEVVVKRIIKDSPETVRLGGVGFVLGEQLEKRTSFETRTVVMAHLQRGGSPTAFDRVLATSFGTKAVEMIVEGEFGKMAGIKGGNLITVPLETVAKGPKTIPLNHRLLKSAHAMGVCFGENRE